MKRMSRRELGVLAAGLAAGSRASLRAQPAAQPSYIGPLTRVESGIDDRGFDPVAFTRRLYDDAPRRLRFAATSRGDAEAWQRTLRARLIELLGGFPDSRSPLRPITLETRAFPAYRREKIVF